MAQLPVVPPRFPVLLIFLSFAPVFSHEFPSHPARPDERSARSPRTCADARGRPRRCDPPFENVAFGARVDASATCGERGPERYCAQGKRDQQGGGAWKMACGVCERGHHGAQLLTDSHSDLRPTWWQSPSLRSGRGPPSPVNLTLRLGKAFEISYIHIKFRASRPESFSLLKRTALGGRWVPLQYYSASCLKTFGRPPDHGPALYPDTALCSAEHSDISPLHGAHIAFSLLEGRPGAQGFQHNTKLQEWVTASELRISLIRLNTFGDEVFGDPQVLSSYFYAISDITVGARCKCNGHASECVREGAGLLKCRCEHHTSGRNCEKCLPLYNDRPWQRAMSNNPHACQKCDCGPLGAERCQFNSSLFTMTGKGGKCINCYGGAFGIHCNLCQPGRYRVHRNAPCQPCLCNVHGSVDQNCDRSGRCVCKKGIGGEKCDHCLPGFHSLSRHGCIRCPCPGNSTCSRKPGTHQFVCDNCPSETTGERCELCAPGFFGDPLGRSGLVRQCRPCHCNMNSDPTMEPCDRQTGQCHMCQPGTTGTHCEKCASGTYGDATHPVPVRMKCRPCNCKSEGTRPGTTCHHENGQCQCLPNVGGQNCGHCHHGYFGYGSRQGCIRCDCSVLGAKGFGCDKRTGQCVCKPGIGGQHCDRCRTGFFNLSSTGCLSCDCDTHGSQDGRCHEDGRCICRPGMAGPRCDRCQNNAFFNRSVSGCQPCPSCYRFVADKVSDAHHRLDKLRQCLDEHEEAGGSGPHKPFPLLLRRLKETATTLRRTTLQVQERDQTLEKQLHMLRFSLANQVHLLSKIEKTTTQANEVLERVKQEVDDTKRLFPSARMKLARAQKLLAQAELMVRDREMTVNPSTPSAALSQLSAEAIDLAELHESSAQDVMHLGMQAQQTSHQAFDAAIVADKEETLAKQEIVRLQGNLESAVELASKMDAEAERVIQSSRRISDKIEYLLSRAQALQPKVDLESLQRKACRVLNHSELLHEEAEKIMQEAKNLDNYLGAQKNNLEMWLKRGITEQQLLDELLVRADAAYAAARDARDKGIRLLEDAKTKLAKLQEMERQFSDSHLNVLDWIEDVRRLIASAENMIHQSEAALDGVQTDANEALSTAQKVNVFTGEMQTEGHHLNVESERMAKRVEDLKAATNDLASRVDRAESRVTRRLKQANSDEQKTKEANEFVAETEGKVKEAEKQIQWILQYISKAHQHLGNLTDLPESEVEELEEALPAVQEARDKLSIQLAELERFAMEQEKQLIAQKDELERTRKDLDSLAVVAESLPNRCFNEDDIERS
uniref:laminin subunit gamma-1-like n=1 Tax=Myxine glutinosa TaxID=7769 RepID=UPI00358ECAA5